MSTSLGSTSLSSGSGLDVGATVDQLMQTERAPERLWKNQQQSLTAQASALRDLNSRLETLETRINTLKDLTGVFGQWSVTSSNESLFSATADSTAATGDHVVSVTQLATIASQYSEPAAASPDSSFTPGDLQLQVSSGEIQTITFDQDHSTLATAAEYINDNDFGISASLVSDSAGTRLVLVSKTPGVAGNLTIASAPQGLGFKVGTAGQNAKLMIDGVPVESATNKVSGALQGVTLQLNGSNSGTLARLAVAPDNGSAQQAIKNFVSAYNDIVTRINDQFKYDPSTKSSGILAGDSAVRSLQSRLLSLAAFRLPGAGSLSTLRSIGIEMEDDGTLKVNDSVLSTAVSNNAEAVKNFFQNGSGDGFAQTLGSQLTSLTDSINGPLILDATGLDKASKLIGDQIDAFEVRMLVRQQQLTDQYTRIDVMLRQMTSMESQISKQLESLQ